MQNNSVPPLPLETLTALCKRRGFIFQSSEIYGGLNGFWDYGPLGTALKNNLRDAWWHDMVRTPPVGPDGEILDIVGLDSAIIQNPRVWEASGHVGGFNDPMCDCRESKSRYRADHLMVYTPPQEGPLFACLVGEEARAEKRIRKEAKADPADYTVRPVTEVAPADLPRVWGPDASKPGTLTEPRQFNLMFKTYIGAASGEDNLAYLRPETAQGIFTNYKNVLDTMRVKLPFGIAQVGKSFRNEVTPRNFIFRSREFEQMELEWFCHPDESQKWYDFWTEHRLNWWKSIGVSPENLRRRDHDPDELAHYSTACADVEYRYGFTAPDFGELEGIAHRGGFDLSQHQDFSGAKLEYFDQETNTRVLPHVIEPSSGLTRGVLVVLNEAYAEEFVPKGEQEGGPVQAPPGAQPPEGYEKRVVMRFSPRLAPVKVAVFPLLKNRPELVAKAKALYMDLRTSWAVDYDQTGAIGRRYRRQDEIGTPFCITVDFDSLEKDTVTIRERDTMKQTTIPIHDVRAWLVSNGL